MPQHCSMGKMELHHEMITVCESEITIIVNTSSQVGDNG